MDAMVSLNLRHALWAVELANNCYSNVTSDGHDYSLEYAVPATNSYDR